MTAAVLYQQGLPHPFTVSKPTRTDRVSLTDRDPLPAAEHAGGMTE
jgi:hypothetical protein